LLARDRTRSWFLGSLRAACEKHAYELYAFVIMPEHVHVIVAPKHGLYDIARFLQSVKQPVAMRAMAWLKKHDHGWLTRLTTTGKGDSHFHFWQQSGGHDRNIIEEETLRYTIDYIHANPVRKGLVESTLAWKWSSARWYETACHGSIFELVHEWPPHTFKPISSA
jgi:putative transposase